MTRLTLQWKGYLYIYPLLKPMTLAMFDKTNPELRKQHKLKAITFTFDTEVCYVTIPMMTTGDNIDAH